MVRVASLAPAEFDDLAGWSGDDHGAALDAFRRSAAHSLIVKPYRTGALGVSPAQMEPVWRAALEKWDANDDRAFFERHFKPMAITPVDGADGFVTGFYEPEVAVSHEANATYRFPFHRRPADLVKINDANRPADLCPSFEFARNTTRGIVEYPDRKAIDSGFLAYRDLEIAFAASKVDVFFAHVQGAARLIFTDGSVRRITYDGKTGHPFTGIGRLLVERGEIPAETVSMAAIRAWLANNPEKADALMWENRSYIFFREAEVHDEELGPVAAAKVPLAPGRSMAVDRTIHTFGLPFFVSAETLTHLDGGAPFQRLMIAQDTGTAIVGPARGDIFTGSGAQAGELAGHIRHPARFHILLPRAVADRFCQ